MRLLGSRGYNSNPPAATPREPSRVRRPWSSGVVRAAAVSGLSLAAVAALALSPLLRVRTVVWTGTLRAPEAQCQALEQVALGRPLLLVGERRLARALHLESAPVRLRVRPHPLHTLEVRLEPRRAVARLDAQTALDARGRVLGARHALAGLPQLVGFELEPGGKRVAAPGREILRQVRALLDTPLLVPARVELQDDEMQLVLADSGTRVRADAAHLEAQLLKLRIFASSLGGEPFPESIDLRFQDQIVVRPERRAHALARRR